MEAYNVFYGIALHQPGRRIPNAVFGFIGQSPRTTGVAGIPKCRLRSGKFHYFAVSVPISTGLPTDLRHRDEASKQNRLAIPKNSEINKRFGR
jgi:hypothetical protein